MRNTWKAAKTKTSLTCLWEAFILNLCRDTDNFDWGGEGLSWSFSPSCGK